MSCQRIAIRIASDFIAKARPSTLFEQAFFDIREKAKKLKRGWEKQAREALENRLGSDLQTRGFRVSALQVKLGRYRGSSFITSAKLAVEAKPPFEAEDERVIKLEKYLKSRYSPKYKLKSVSNGVANFNVR